MSDGLSANTQAALLLTAPLIVGGGNSPKDLLSLNEYKRVRKVLREGHRQMAELMGPDASELVSQLHSVVDPHRLRRLLGRGFGLGQAVERWNVRAIWVAGCDDARYPQRLLNHLGDDSPPVLYGCGDPALLDARGLAVVGSRRVSDPLARYTQSIGSLVAEAGLTVISGGARGVDQAAMRGALEAGGTAIGVTADSLERAALNRDNRDLLLDSRLVLISPYDPTAGFNVGHAMQRNKLIYALADAALVVSSDVNAGGTWAGAVEQLEKLRFTPVYVRSKGELGKGLEALLRKGAWPWPNPATGHELVEFLAAQRNLRADRVCLPLPLDGEPPSEHHIDQRRVDAESPPESQLTPAEELFATVRALLQHLETPRSETEVAAELNVSTRQSREWLMRLVGEGVLEKLSAPVRYRSARGAQAPLFEQGSDRNENVP